MQVETKFLRLRQPVALGFEIDGWRVCWLGGWGKHRLYYFVMVTRVNAAKYQGHAARPLRRTQERPCRNEEPHEKTARRSTNGNAQR
jgi:hypothetical protein